MRVDILVVGRLKTGPYANMISEFHKRMRWELRIIEFEAKARDSRAAQREENEKLLHALHNNAAIIALDEHGQNLTSLDFAKKIEGFQNAGYGHMQCIIGGADGLEDAVKKRANLTLSLGAMTWPHMLARVMLVEQLYRAQQILNGHPYHRA